MLDLVVIEDPKAAAAALDPVRAGLLAALAEPLSAAGLAAKLGLTRQKVNYYLRSLEALGLVKSAGEKRWGGLTERRLIASARSYTVSAKALGPLATDPARSRDRLSARYLIALAARAVREVGGLWRRARDEDKRLATLAIDTAIHFRSPGDRRAFADDLMQAVTALAARYHDPAAPDARAHRLVVLAHPLPKED
jgi:predicted ArsR family transcriptional regulator